jgi:hypothetical protein
MKARFIILLLFCTFSIDAQVIDLNLIGPRTNAYVEFFSGPFSADSLSFNSVLTGASATIPLKTKLKLKLLKKQGSVSQHLFRFDARRRFTDMNKYTSPVISYGGAAGLFGIRIKYKNKKLWAIFYGAEFRFEEQFQNYSGLVPLASTTVGGARIYGKNKIIFYGGYLGYVGGRIIPVPLLGGIYPISKRWSIVGLLPVQVKLSVKVNKRFKQDIICSVYGFRTGVHNNNLLATSQMDRIDINTNGLKLSTQSKIKLNHNFVLNAEMGIITNRTSLTATDSAKENLDSNISPYFRVTLNMIFGDSILKKVNKLKKKVSDTPFGKDF